MTTDPDFIQGYYLEILRNYVLVSGLAWYMYDYMLTFPLEISAVWKAKFSGTSILFLINRYLFMISCISEVLAHVYTTKSIIACKCMISVWFISTSFYTIAIWLIFLLRAYAICGRNRLVLCLLLPLYIAKVGIDVWNIHDTIKHTTIVASPDNFTKDTCTSIGSSRQSSILTIISIVDSTIIFISTLSRTWSIFRESRAVGIKLRLTTLLLRDGSLYFGLVMCLAVFSVVISFIIKTSVPLFTLIGLYVPMPVVLANRLVLNLRSFGESHSNSGGAELGPVDNAENVNVDAFFRTAYGRQSNGQSRFDNRSIIDTILGNIGEPLGVGDEDDDEGDESEDVTSEREEIEGSQSDISGINELEQGI